MDDAFIRALAECPNDETTRLAYADWLEEQSDPRATFVRVECLLASVAAKERFRRLLLLADLLRHARGCDSTWARQVSRTPLPPLACRLILSRTIGPGSAHPDANVELVNEGGQPVSIERSGTTIRRFEGEQPVLVERRWHHLFAELDLIYWDTRGEPMQSSYYGHKFMGTGKASRPPRFELLPGEAYRHSVALWGNLNRPRDKPFPEDWGLPAGMYTAQAVFRNQNWIAVSDPIPFEFRPREKK